MPDPSLVPPDGQTLRERRYDNAGPYRYPHMCRDGHVQIGHSDNSSEMCPLCRALSALHEAEQRAKTLEDRNARQALTIHEKTEAWRREWENGKALEASLSEARQKEAECHDIISDLWAITDPEGADKELLARVHAVLGAESPDGHCGNTICAQLSEARQERDELFKLAYIGDHHFPDLTYKARLEEVLPKLRTLGAQVSALREGINGLPRYWVTISDSPAEGPERFVQSSDLDTLLSQVPEDRTKTEETRVTRKESHS